MSAVDLTAPRAAAAPPLATVPARVRAVRDLTPNLAQVTLEVPAGYDLTGGDEFVYVMMSSEPGGIAPGYSMEVYREQAADGPVRGAYYTVRRHRPSACELDLWVVVHGHPGSVGDHLVRAPSGAPLALWGPRTGFVAPPGARRLLLVADESGLAAVSAVIEAAPRAVAITAVLETVDRAHEPPLPSHPGLDVTWVHRGVGRPGAVNRLLDAVRTLVPTAPDAVFGAAESRHISAVRRHARASLGVPASCVHVTGYWRADR